MLALQLGNHGNQLPPPPPPPASARPSVAGGGGAGANSNATNAERRSRALAVDRFARVAFPLTFSILNCIYWINYAEYL